MRISRVSFSSANSRLNFNGIFREVKRDTYEDREQRVEVTRIHSVYHPNKNESEQDIKKAMSEYRARGGEYNQGTVLDGGVDSYGNPTTTQGWSYQDVYTCERGGRLPY